MIYNISCIIYLYIIYNTWYIYNIIYSWVPIFRQTSPDEGSWNGDTPKSSIYKLNFHYKPSILGYPIYGNTQIGLVNPFNFLLENTKGVLFFVFFRGELLLGNSVVWSLRYTESKSVLQQSYIYMYTSFSYVYIHLQSLIYEYVHIMYIYMYIYI
jgi:hypothetical protein